MEACPSGHSIACRFLRTRWLWIPRSTWRSIWGDAEFGERIEDLDQPVGVLEAWKSKMIAILSGHPVQRLLSDRCDHHQDDEHHRNAANQNPDAQAIRDECLDVLCAG